MVDDDQSRGNYAITLFNVDLHFVYRSGQPAGRVGSGWIENIDIFRSVEAQRPSVVNTIIDSQRELQNNIHSVVVLSL